MRNLLLIGTAALALAASTAAFAEPNENPLTNAPHGQTWQGPVTGSAMTEGRSAYIFDGQTSSGSSSLNDRAPRS